MVYVFSIVDPLGTRRAGWRGKLKIKNQKARIGIQNSKCKRQN
jgi:hypothetical protein